MCGAAPPRFVSERQQHFARERTVVRAAAVAQTGSFNLMFELAQMARTNSVRDRSQTRLAYARVAPRANRDRHGEVYLARERADSVADL
jgi:hypothetical protein